MTGPDRPAPPVRHCFEMWVGTVISAAVLPRLPLRVTRTAVRQESMYSVLVDGRRDLADVVGRLQRSGVRVLDIRAWEQPAPRGGVGPGDPGR